MAEPLTKTREKNLRHGVATWGEVPTPGDVRALLATIDALRDQLKEAQELGRRAWVCHGRAVRERDMAIERRNRLVEENVRLRHELKETITRGEQVCEALAISSLQVWLLLAERDRQAARAEVE